MKKNIKDYNLDELKNVMVELGEKSFRAEQIFKWIFVENVTSFDEMTNLSLELREKLKEKFDLIEQFEDIKSTYLDKPLAQLSNCISAITDSSEAIKKACRNIDDQCDKVNRNYINQINEKLSKFNIKLEKNVTKKMDE